MVSITWNWAAQELINGFDPAADVLDFGHIGASQARITEVGANLVIEVLNNGGHTYTLAGIQAEDLKLQNLQAADYNDALEAPGGVIAQLSALGFDELLG